jgi:hypothetical protein
MTVGRCQATASACGKFCPVAAPFLVTPARISRMRAVIAIQSQACLAEAAQSRQIHPRAAQRLKFI